MSVGTELGKIAAIEMLINIWPKYEAALIEDLEATALAEEEAQRKEDEEQGKEQRKMGRAARASLEAAATAKRANRHKEAQKIVKRELEAIFPLVASYIDTYKQDRPPIRLQVKGCEFIMALLDTEELKTNFVISHGDAVASIVNMVTRKYVGVSFHRRQKKWEASIKRRRSRGFVEGEEEMKASELGRSSGHETADDFYYERLGFFSTAEEAAHRYDEEADKLGRALNFPIAKNGFLVAKAVVEGAELKPLGIRTLLHMCDGETPRVDQLVRKSDPTFNETLKGLLFYYQRQQDFSMRDTVTTLLRELDQEGIIGEFCLGIPDEEMTDEMKEIKDELRAKARRKDYKMLSGVRKHFSTTELRQHQQAFKKVDADNSGSIDNQELGIMFHDYGLNINSAQLDLLIKESDVDGNGTIDFQEFLLIMLKIKKGKLGGPAADFAKAAREMKVGAAASALKERMFGMSRKKREAIERADARRAQATRR